MFPYHAEELAMGPCVMSVAWQWQRYGLTRVARIVYYAKMQMLRN
jgi:hypothetical protein